MMAYLLDWLSLLGRWLHLVAGIAWIGSSFYFIWLDNHLVPPADPVLARQGVAGELWAVHGGGFYRAHKYRVAPPSLPPMRRRGNSKPSRRPIGRSPNSRRLSPRRTSPPQPKKRRSSSAWIPRQPFAIFFATVSSGTP